jgi:hypothetical protein
VCLFIRFTAITFLNIKVKTLLSMLNIISHCRKPYIFQVTRRLKNCSDVRRIWAFLIPPFADDLGDLSKKAETEIGRKVLLSSFVNIEIEILAQWTRVASRYTFGRTPKLFFFSFPRNPLTHGAS